MADEDPSGGLGILRSRVERRSRQVPPPRNSPPLTSEDQATILPSPALAMGEGSEATVVRASSNPSSRVRPRRATPPAPGLGGHPHTSPDEPSANLAIRVRRSLDEHLAELIFDLRRDGIRTSKVELIEMLLWELPAKPASSFTERLSAFRRAAPRGDQL